MNDKITVVACEFCGHSEKYSAGQIGADSYYDVRARICRHEQRCPENPLVKTIMGIRAKLKSTRIRPDQLDLCIKLKEAIRMTYDCFLDVEVEKEIRGKTLAGTDEHE